MQNTIPKQTLPPLVIPTYEPEEGFIGLVDQLLTLEFPIIIVVNDGSSASKKNIFNELKTRPKVIILNHAINMGKGAALKTAFNYFLTQMPDIDRVITVDADGQHLPEDVLRLAQEPFAGHEMGLGIRTFKKDIPLRSLLGNVVTKFVFRFLIGKSLNDTQSGLRSIPKTLMLRLLTVQSNRYEFELEMLIVASHEKFGIKEVPISTVYENNNKSSHFNPLLDSAKIYFVFLRFISWSVVIYCSDLSMFTLAFRVSGNILTSIVLGRICGLVVSIFGLRSYVFKSDKKISGVVLKIFILWLVLLGISYGLMTLFVNNLHLNVYISRIFVDSALFLFNFLVQRELIFTDSLTPIYNLALGNKKK